MPLSSFPTTVDVLLGPRPLLGSLSGPPLPVGLSASAPPYFPIGGRRSGLLSGNPPGPWALRRGVLWWHRTLSSSQELFSLDQGGTDPPLSQVGVWTLSLGFPLPVPGRGPQWRLPTAPVPPVWRRLWCREWAAARRPTPVGVTSSVLCKPTASACGRPPKDFSPTLSTPVISPPARCPRPPCCWQNP